MDYRLLLPLSLILAVGLGVSRSEGHADPPHRREGPAPARADHDDAMNGDSAATKSLMVFAAEGNSSDWLLIRVNLNSGKSHTVLRASRAEAVDSCGFAQIDADKVVFYNGMVLETWSLRSGKKTSTVKTEQSVLQTLDYNPASTLVEGVCQMWLPEQNMSATCWCSVHDGNVSAVYQMPSDYFGEARSACVSYIDPGTDFFWYPAAAYNNVNRFFVGLATSSGATGYDWKWFGAINGTTAYDAYAYDNGLNRSFAIQLSVENTTSQLVEVFHGIEPYSKNNTMPKVLYVFADNFGLCDAGMAAYDQSVNTMYAIMKRHVSAAHGESRVADDNLVAQYLVKINVLTLKVTLQQIQWPTVQSPLKLASVRLWNDSPTI